MSKLLFDGWQGPIHVLILGLLSYAFLIALLRLTGKRTLSKMNAFDLVVTVAMGSTFGTILLDTSVSFVEGASAFTVLALMQYAVSWTSVRSERVEHLVKSFPTVLVWRGKMLDGAMRDARVSEAEVLAACREQGAISLERVEALVLETSGDFSVLERSGVRNDGGLTTLPKGTGGADDDA